MNKLPTVDIKGSPYTLVKDRILAFNELYPNGCIQTRLISEVGSDRIVVRATVIPDVGTPDRKFIDHAQEEIGDGYINKTSAMENCCTSAVGRALAYMGIGVVDSVASVDEINKAKVREYNQDNTDFSGKVFIKTKWIANKAERDAFNKGIKDLGGKWVAPKKVWAIPEDEQKNLKPETLKGIEAILNTEGEVIPFITGEAEIDILPF